MVSCFYLLAFIASAHAALTVDLNCTVYDTVAAEFVYAPSAANCNDALSQAACNTLYPVGAIKVGTALQKPYQCFGLAAAGPIDANMKRAALEQCPKHCGLCCQTAAFSCPNAQYPSMNCATITQSQCQSATWRPIIARECPAACGFCLDGGCVDAVVECANDISICNAIGLQTFVNTNCQKTCGRCTATTAAGTATCTRYNADSSTSCRSWAANGFCTNTFYTTAQRKAYCATSCRIC